ncbi:MAG TPA: hypothetical protein VJL58_03015, partial [Pyrinomonadaceae bacterium]|nr:hypothetical protein [Pyrinomonadaceae bacterium]
QVDSQDRGINVSDILSSLGIAAAKETGGWKVTSIAEKSQAEKAGVQISDLVEAVGSHEVKGKDSLNGSVSADSVRVVRAGKRLVIKFAGR